MKEMTRQNLAAAFAGESQAHMRYMVYGDVAEREGLPNVARLFRAAAYSEQMHATAHLRALGGVANTVKNLQTALGGEDFEVAEMYPAYTEVAQLQEENGALRSMSNAFEAEKVHSTLYNKACGAASARQDVELKSVYVCETCGYTIEAGEGDEPQRCPICGAIHFRKF